MDSENHTFLQVVRLQNAELWHSRDSDLVLSDEGDVQILHSQSLNQFVLRLKDFKIILDKSVHIISSIVGRHQRQAYLLPRGVGFTMIRLHDGKSYPALQNFETLLENTSSFSRKSGLDPTLATFNEVRETGGMASSLLQSVAKALAPTVDDSHPNQKIVRSFEELTQVDSHGSAVVDLKNSELDNLSKKSELDHAGSETSDLWKSFMGEGVYTGNSKHSSKKENKEGYQTTGDVPQGSQTHKYHPSMDNQEITGAQQQRLPSYEVHNSQEFLQKNLRKASANVPSGEAGSGDEQADENAVLPEPEHFEDEAFTFGLLTKDHTQANNVGVNQTFPVAKEDAFKDLTHPMRKFSAALDRPFLNIDEESESAESDKPKAEAHKGFHGQPILTAKGQPNLKSNIDDQPSPIPNTEKYSEPVVPEKSTFAKSTETQPAQPSTVGQPNVARQPSQDSESKKNRKVSGQPVDKENLTTPTAI